MEIGKKINVDRIVPARSFYYMYAYTDAGNFFIYSHRNKVNFFATHKADGLPKFQDNVVKLTSFKYFNEKSEQCPEKIKKVDFENPNSEKVLFGSCLISDLGVNHKVQVWVDSQAQKITFQVEDAGEFKNNLNSDIELPDLAEEQRIANKIKLIDAFKAQNNHKLIQLIEEQPNFFKRLISKSFPFSSSHLSKFSKSLDWKEISENTNIQWNMDDIKNFDKSLDWSVFSQNNQWTLGTLKEFEEKIDWSSLSLNTKIDWQEIIEVYENKLNWKNLSKNVSFDWSKENIIKYQSKIDWYNLCSNNEVAFDFSILQLFENKIDWNIIATNQGNWWTKEIIEFYKNKLRWRNLLVYGTFWNEELIEHFRKEIENDYGFAQLSENPNVDWTLEILEKYEDELGWGNLAENPGLPWSFELIEKYKENWNWSYLGSIAWNFEFADKHINDFTTMNGSSSLWTNKTIIKNEEFCIKHKDILFPPHKGSGMTRWIDASANDELPVSTNFFYELKDNLDWDRNLFSMLKRTGKYNNLIKDINLEIVEFFDGIEHFSK